MIELTLKAIFDAAGVLWTSMPAGSRALLRSIDEVSTDTRELRPGSLFVGLSGPQFNGADFASAALEAGASAVLVQAPAEDAPRLLEELTRLSERFVAPIAVCADTRVALGKIGHLIRRTSTAKAVAITGSCGKTSTKSIVAHMLRAGSRSPDATVVASPKSFNNYVGVPRTLMLAERTTEYMVLEVGTNGPGEIEDLAAIAAPDVAMITTIGRAHLEGLGSVEGIAEEKGMLLAALDPSRPGAMAVLNADCPMLPRLLAHVPEGVPVMLFGGDRSNGRGPGVWTRAVRATARGTEFQLSIDAELTPGREITDRPIVIPLLGDHAAANVAASIAVVLALGGDFDAALSSIATLEAEPHRLQPTLAGGVLVIDDAYNANPESMAAAIATLMGVERAAAQPLAGSRPARRVLVAGAMGEMGSERLNLHREVGGVASSRAVDCLYLVGEAHDRDALIAMGEGAVAEGLAPENVHLCEDLPGAIAALTAPQTGLASGDICLVKASRAARLERVVDALTEHFAAPSHGDELSLTALDSEKLGEPKRNQRPGAHT